MKIEVNGIEVQVEHADHYLQMNDLCAAELGSVWAALEAQYADYEKLLCYHQPEIPEAMLAEMGAVLVDDCIEMRADAERFADAQAHGVVRVGEQTFAAWAAHHDQCHQDMYWTGERIGRDLSRWAIFALWANERMAGYLLLAMWHPGEAEIFCVVAADSAQAEALLTAAARFASQSARTTVLYMADRQSVSEKAAASVGFAATGIYKAYKIEASSATAR